MHGTKATVSAVHEHFGEHIMVDGYRGDAAKLNDGDLVRNSLLELCALLRMHALAPPLIANAPDSDFKDPGGWSGFLIISESHIALHTFPRRQFLSADVYSCRNGMAAEQIVEFLERSFALQEVETNFVRRGLKYPVHNLVC